MAIYNGSADDDIFNGDAGDDTVIFDGVAAGYRVDTLHDGRIRVVDIDASNGDTGTDILSSIEMLSFSDKSYSTVIEATLVPEGLIEVNSTPEAGHGHSNPATTTLTDGGYVITWTADDQDGSQTGIYAQRYDAAGNAVGAETRINSYTVLWQDVPAVTAVPDGGYIITWASYDHGNTNTGVYAQRYDADNNPVGVETRINRAGDEQVSAPAVTTLQNGGYVVTWSEWNADGSYDGIAAQRFDADGSSVGAETVINTYTYNSQTGPQIAALADGGYVITWQSGHQGGIHFQRFDADGNTVGEETQVISEGYESAPAVITLTDGGFVIASTSDSAGIFIHRYDANGDASGPDIRVNTTAISSGGTPALSGLADGGFVVTWSANDTLYAQCFDASSSAVGPEIVFGSVDYWATEISPTVTALPDGSYIVAWAEDFGNGIRAQRFDTNGAPWGPPTLHITGVSADDVLNGGNGSQRIEGLAGNDILDGGEGTDIAVFAGNSDGYLIEYQPSSGQIRITDVDTSDGDTGTDMLTGFESLEFSDKSYQISTSDLLVNAPEGEGQNNAHTVVSSDGSYIIAWESGPGWDSQVYCQRYDANGNVLGAQTPLSWGHAWGDENPVIALLNNGGYVVAYAATKNQGSTNSGIFLRCFDADGNAIGNEIQVNPGYGEETEAAVTAFADGGFLVTWTQEGYSEADNLVAQRFAADGSKVGGQTFITTAANSPSIAALSDGGYICVWDALAGGIHAKRYDAAGNIVMGEIAISGTTGDNPSYPDVAAFSSGGYIITWSSSTRSSSTRDDIYTVHSQRYDAEGQALGPEVLITSTADGWPQPTIAGLDGGGYVIAWDSYDAETYNYDIHSQRFDSSGNKVGEETRINTETGENLNPEISSLAGGGYVITWTLNNDLGEQVCVQRFDANGNLQIPAALKITGTDGNDVIRAGGQQVLYGLDGDDTYVLSHRNRVIESGGGGTDVVQASVSYTLGENLENLTLTGSGHVNGNGNKGNNTIRGNDGDNILDGGIGTDVLIGGMGNDTLISDDDDGDALIGGGGDDTYVVADGWYNAIITEAVDGGIDTVRTARYSYTLTSNLEHLVLTGSYNSQGTGNSGNNTITGNSSNNTLDGGSGIDTLIGGLGNDTYVVNTTTDILIENACEGADTVQSSATFTLADHFENLTLTGSAGISGIGNTLNNVLTGNSGNNMLYGGDGDDTLTGGNGVDTLFGELGNDIYIVDTTTDVLTENVGEGTDTVWSSVTFTLGDNIENLTLTGNTDINGTGNALNNVLTGNTGVNTLDGGNGADTLIGGLGNDTLNGGDGTDVAAYSGRLSNYRIFLEHGTLKIQDLVTGNGDEGIDTLLGIETLRFSGGLEVAVATYEAGEGPTSPQIGEFQVNTTTIGSQAWSKVASLADGGFIMAWRQASTGNNGGIYAQRFDANGNQAGWQLQVNANLIEDYPVVAGLANGGFVVSGRSWGEDGDTAGVYAQVYDSTGSKVGDEIQVNVITEGSQDDPRITSLSNGNFVVTWTSDSDDSDIYARVFNADGTPASGEFRINTTTSDHQWVANVAALTNGGFVVSWASAYQDGDDDGVYARIYDSAGVPVSGELAVNTHTDNAQSHPSVAGLNDGSFIVCWTSQEQDGDSGGIYAQRFSETGAKIGDEFRVNTTVSDDQDISDIKGLKGGGFVVTWSDSGYDGESNADYYGVYAQIYDATGNPVGDEFRVNTYVNNIQNSSSVAALEDGGFIINWTSNGQDGSGHGSYAQRYTADGMPAEVDGTVISITGDAGNNTLAFVGGPARLSGGAGNDTYMVRHAYDKTIENVSAGTDTVKAALSWTLANNVENLSLTGTGNFTGTGNALSNVLTGNSGSNVLSGLSGNDTLNGGSGADTLIGGLGSDTYIIDSASDIITEAASAGTDTVRSAVSKTLGANLENLIFTGSAALNGIGNTLANTLTGNTGANTLNASSGNDTLNGGAGKDKLTGGAGLDKFVFSNALSSSTNLDTITDFKAADDTIQIDNAIFKKLTKVGVLSSANFKASTTGKAADTNDYILYETDTGKLFYDADGSGKGAAIQFALIGGHPDNITYKDFSVI